mmetsp:Transcript_11668/g.30838  ORF Transcript_11668/g.30838 Transcript_11668/m.30838 type:complete len:268 (+) Transcript_11668:538-1341(+)
MSKKVLFAQLPNSLLVASQSHANQRDIACGDEVTTFQVSRRDNLPHGNNAKLAPYELHEFHFMNALITPHARHHHPLSRDNLLIARKQHVCQRLEAIPRGESRVAERSPYVHRWSAKDDVDELLRGHRLDRLHLVVLRDEVPLRLTQRSRIGVRVKLVAQAAHSKSLKVEARTFATIATVLEHVLHRHAHRARVTNGVAKRGVLLRRLFDVHWLFVQGAVRVQGTHEVVHTKRFAYNHKSRCVVFVRLRRLAFVAVEVPGDGMWLNS